jgi:uroporphyrinogen III methyltransferase/synthase
MTGQKKNGKVYLVGAGPGSADLITVRGAELLKSADCIICDKLVDSFLLNFASPDAEIVNVPKRTGDGSFKQEQINKLLIEKAQIYKTVVRLKGGDPCIFGRGAEEAAVLAQAGIDFEIVPGITAGIAAAEYTGIMLTDRNYSSQVVFVTGREAEGKVESNIDWRWLAKFKGTIVFYMGVENLALIASKLIKKGMKDDTPAAVISDVSLPSQRIVEGPLGLISERCKSEGIEPPAMVVIGAAAGRNTALDWFMKKPLFGKTIVVTRDRRGNIDFAAKILREGGRPIDFATIRIKPLTETDEFLQILSGIAKYDWIIFTSANGASIFFDCLKNLKKDARVFGAAKIAAIGSETAGKLGEFGIRADFVPSVFTGRELGKQLAGFTSLHGKKVLLLRSENASAELVGILESAGAEVENMPVYANITEKTESGRLRDKIAKGEIDWITFASPSSVKGFFEQIPPDVVSAGKARVASIGPVTSEALASLGVKIVAEAAEHTIDGLLAAIKETYE